MDLGEYVYTLVKAYNPNQYPKLLEHHMGTFIKFLMITLVFCLIIFILLIVPVTYEYISTIPQTTAQAEQLKLHADVKSEHPITLIARPSIILDPDANQTQEGAITLTDVGIVYPKYLFFGTGVINWDTINDLKTQTQTRDRVLAGIVFFLLPSIVFWFFLYSLLKIGFIFIGLLILGYFLPRLFKHVIRFRDTIKVGILALPSLLIIGVGLYPLAPLFWWGLLLTTIFFFAGIALVSEIKSDEIVHKHKV